MKSRSAARGSRPPGRARTKMMTLERTDRGVNAASQPDDPRPVLEPALHAELPDPERERRHLRRGHAQLRDAGEELQHQAEQLRLRGRDRSLGSELHPAPRQRHQQDHAEDQRRPPRHRGAVPEHEGEVAHRDHAADQGGDGGPGRDLSDRVHGHGAAGQIAGRVASEERQREEDQPVPHRRLERRAGPRLDAEQRDRLRYCEQGVHPGAGRRMPVICRSSDRCARG